jgi:hypothetical protein
MTIPARFGLSSRLLHLLLKIRMNDRLLQIILWLMFFAIPISFTTLLVDNFVVIKWIFVYLIGIFFCFRHHQGSTRISYPNFYICLLGLGLLAIRAVLLLCYRNFNMEWFSFFDAILFCWLCIKFSQEPWDWPDWLERVRTPALAGLAFVVARSHYHFFSARFYEGYFGTEAFASSFGNINMLAEYLVLMLPLLFYYTSDPQLLNTSKLNTSKPNTIKFLSQFLFGSTLFILYWSQCRSAFVALLLYLVFIIWKKLWLKIHLKIAVICLVSSLALHLYWTNGELSMIDRGKLASNTARLSLLQSSLSLMATKPFGIGTELFEFYIAPFRINTADPLSEKVLDRTPHNEFLRWGIEFGWAYLMVIIVFYFLWAKEIWNSKNPLAIGFGLVLLPQIIFQFPFLNAFPFVVTAFFIGVFLRTQAKVKTKTLSPRGLIITSILIGLTASITLVCFTWSKFDEVNGNRDLLKAQRACDLYPVNWRSCINVAHLLLDSGKPKQALPLLRAELNRHPFNIIALRFAVLIQLKLGHQDLACQGADLYETLVKFKGQYRDFVRKVCGDQGRFAKLEGLALENAYFEWLQQTALFAD